MDNEKKSEPQEKFSTPADFNPLSLDNQLCFSLYVCSKEIIRHYTPILEPLGITYTMYLVLMALWEKDNVSVKELGHRIFLDSGTLTPLLKKMEALELVSRTREKKDERSVAICLTEKGRDFRNQCVSIPSKMACSTALDLSQVKELLRNLHSIMEKLSR